MAESILLYGNPQFPVDAQALLKARLCDRLPRPVYIIRTAMVAPSTQPSPLQHHIKTAGGPSSSSSSLKNYSRIHSQVEREGFEVHKENLLAPPAAGKNKLWGAGEKLELRAPCSSLTGPAQTPGKTGLWSLLPTESGAIMSHGRVALRHLRQDMCSKPVNAGLGSSILENPPASSGFSDLLPLGNNVEAKIDSNFYSNVFPPQGCTVMSACLTIAESRQTQDCCLSSSMMAKHGETKQSISGLEENVLHDAKRIRYTSAGEDGMSMQMQNHPNYEQCFTSHCVIDQNRTKAHPARNVYNSNVGAPEWETNSKVCVGTLQGMSVTVEMSKTSSADGGWKPFTASIHAQLPKALSTFSDGEPSLPLSLEQSQLQVSSRTQKTALCNGSYSNDDWGKFLALSATPIGKDVASVNATVFPFQQRFKQLQAFLKQCDETDQNDCLHALRSLSAAARSGHAVELETRAIRLSLEEGQEMKRMRLLNVLGRMTDRSFEDAGATPQGPRLPAPGVVAKCKNVS